MPKSKPLTCIDLSHLCGDLSLGMLWAGFEILAAVDFNKEAVETCHRNPGR